MAQAAVERKFEIIGEALNQLAKFDDALAALERRVSHHDNSLAEDLSVKPAKR